MGEHIHNVTGYSAGWNLPGCVPDGDVYEFDTAELALDYLYGEASRAYDETEEKDPRGDLWYDLRQEIAADMKAAHRTPCDTYYYSAPDGYRWWVEVQTDCE